MADIIRLSVGDAEATKTKFRKQRDIILNSVKTMEKEVSKVPDWWKADSAKAYVDKFQMIKAYIDKSVNECVDEYCNLLDSVIKAYQDADQQIMGKISNS